MKTPLTASEIVARRARLGEIAELRRVLTTDWPRWGKRPIDAIREALKAWDQEALRLQHEIDSGLGRRQVTHDRH